MNSHVRLFLNGLICSFLVAGALLLATVDTEAPNAAPDSRAAIDRSAEKVQDLIDKHDCWVAKTPEGIIPGHAVVTLPGGSPKYAKSQVAFDIWLGKDEQPSTGDERAGRVHAFCK